MSPLVFVYLSLYFSILGSSAATFLGGGGGDGGGGGGELGGGGVQCRAAGSGMSAG